jgi:tRNA(Ile)-lysidine synthase
MRARFLEFVRRKQLVQPGDRVLVAVSGGVDSMVLLNLLHRAAPTLGITVTAAHFDHAMRGTSADDAAWLAGVCQAWLIPLITARADEALYGENAARNARYKFLTEAAARIDATRIATAHHADDQIETVLFRMMRGTGLRGLAGIPLRRGRIIRPLLRFRKSRVEAFAGEQLIPFRTDETNATDAFARNRIRRTVIPALQTVTPTAPDGILALARHAARAERAWEQLMKDVRRSVVIHRDADFIELARGILLEYDAETRSRLLRGELRRFGVAPDARATRTMLRFTESGTSGSGVTLPGKLRLERAYDVLRLTRARAIEAGGVVVIDECGEGHAVVRLHGEAWIVRWTTSATPRTSGDGVRFDCAELKFPLQVRAWRAGDRLRFAYGTKKLKKIFAEARVPIHLRATVPVLADAQGRVYWVAGVARSMDAPPRNNLSALTITIEHAQIS